MNTVEDYIANDKDIRNMPEYLREIHAARRVIMDETSGMTAAEENNYHRENIKRAFDELGIPPPRYENLTGQGHIKIAKGVIPK